MVADDQLSEAVAAFQRGDLGRARNIAEERLSAGSASSEIHHLLGLIHCRCGELDKGVEHLQRAAAAEPANAAYRVMLARALIDSGRPEEVLIMPEPARDNAPASLAFWHARAEAADKAGDAHLAKEAWQVMTATPAPDWRAWSNLGNAHARLEEWNEAADALRRAVMLNPSEAAIRRNLASALANRGSFEESVVEFEHAVRIDSNHLESQLTLARLLTDLGRADEALARLDQATALAPGNVEAAMTRGRSLVALTRFDEAERVYRSALAIARTSPAAIRELGLLLERTSRMDELKQLLEAAADEGIGPDQLGYLWAAVSLRDGDAERAQQVLAQDSSDQDPVRWNRLKAKIADALGEPEMAFAAATAMNRAAHDYSGWRERGAKYRASIRGLVPVITPEWVSRLPRSAEGERRTPAFLVGFPRSGTTLLDTFLMGHPDTAVLEEVHMLGGAEQVIGKVAELPRCSTHKIEDARRAYFAELDRHVDQSFSGLVVDKLPLNMLGLPLIHTLFPDARIIFAQRHPCDAVLSGFMQSFVMNDAMACFLDIADAADLYDAAMGVWQRSRDLIPAAVHDLVYEDLVAAPETTLKPLIDFLGLEWRHELLDHRSTARKRGAIITPSYDQVTEPLSSRPSGRWLRYAKQLEPVLPVLLPWAERLGYHERVGNFTQD